MTLAKELGWDKECTECLLRIKSMSGMFMIVGKDVYGLYELGKEMGPKQMVCGIDDPKRKHSFKDSDNTRKFLNLIFSQNFYVSFLNCILHQKFFLLLFFLILDASFGKKIQNQKK